MRALPLCLAILSASPAAAFICPDPDPVRDFQAIAASPHGFVVVWGDLSATGAGQESGTVLQMPMRVQGRQLGRAGFTTPVTLDFTLRHDCGTALSCPVAAAEGEALVFLRREGEGLVLEPGLCSERAHFGIDRATLDAVAACHGRGDCD
ncbi:hypothetical protein HKCCSP123_05820 [Rhodobacterales bacterium HKCCSP123]|nr:hypothetical protein [Rhodobacterales bacterium HKCCSP123]